MSKTDPADSLGLNMPRQFIDWKGLEISFLSFKIFQENVTYLSDNFKQAPNNLILNN